MTLADLRADLHQFSIHSCLLSRYDWKTMLMDPETAKKLGIKHYRTPPWRIHVNTLWWHFAFALRPGSRFSRIKNYVPRDQRPPDWQEPEWEYASDWTSSGRWSKDERIEARARYHRIRAKRTER